MYKDKVVIVTGSGNGIGQSVAAAYAMKGANVVVTDKDEQAGNETKERINSEGGKAIFLSSDNQNPEDIDRVVDQVMDQYGRIDILINNAGISKFKPVDELSVEEWDEVLNTNLRGAFLYAQKAARHMKNNHHGGSIVNISSTRAFMSEPDSEAYAASKGGIFSLTHAMALSYQEQKITVNCISPGWIQTENYDQLREIDHQQHPSKRVGKTEDIARACLFLTNPLNDFITGENLMIDGGMTRKMIY